MDIPQSWKDLLQRVQQQCPSAVLAGGALRDLDHGVPPKDLDIFIEVGDIDEALVLCEKLGGVTPENDDLDEDDNKVYPASMAEVKLVADYDHEKNKLGVDVNLPVQFIFVDWRTHSIVERFDYGICRIAYNGREIIEGSGYESDKMNKTMTIFRCKSEMALSSSVMRFARLKQKYPDHRWCWQGNLIKVVGED